MKTCERCGGAGRVMDAADNLAVGMAMRAKRLAMGLTLEDMGARMGMTKQAVHYWETRGDAVRWTPEARGRYEAALIGALRTKEAGASRRIDGTPAPRRRAS